MRRVVIKTCLGFFLTWILGVDIFTNKMAVRFNGSTFCQFPWSINVKVDCVNFYHGYKYGYEKNVYVLANTLVSQQTGEQRDVRDEINRFRFHPLELFGSDDPFYGLAFNAADERAKTPASSVEGNQLISYTGNIPDFEDINMPELECENSQECLSPTPSSTLNTPQVQIQSPSYTIKP